LVKQKEGKKKTWQHVSTQNPCKYNIFTTQAKRRIEKTPKNKKPSQVILRGVVLF